MSAVRVHADDLAVVESPRRVAILDLASLAAPPVLLADSAATIWSLVDGQRDDHSIVLDVADMFGMDPSQVRTEVLDCLEHLSRLGLLTQLDA